ncbi:sugar-transfer associated ATP-grasp domain-containing protein [Phaeobacter marinintestinus]|uniref:sugar-transfer associated ATP-grasp domain-containing protein n=1 Tax=Falsiphaeobacter marinintestinus TaxID=1492905 RepID=UPI0011B59822|nr:sugar-transfer associated ATP-grasp domain-containing protein [Phaeobacter marinintestinus]
MTMTATQTKALVTPPKAPGAAKAPVIVDVARKFGVSPVRQLKEMVLLSRGTSRLATHEYYSAGLYDPALSMDEKRAYVGVNGSYDLNVFMSPTNLTGARFFVQDKVVYTALLNELGFRATRTQAVAQADRLFGNIPSLATPQEIRSFLQNTAEYPVFAKPARGTGSFGSALLSGVDGDQLVLGNGRTVDLDAFCTEILQDYPDGFLFQSALVQHSDLTDVAGPAIGTIRVVTVRDSVMPRMLYSLWKIPSPKAMSDNFWQDGSMIASITEDGRLGRCRIGTGLNARLIDEHPVSGVKFADVRVPFFDQIPDIASRAHALFPDFGVIGWDIAITPEGPTIIEANDNPFHALYQLAFGRGIRNPDFMPVFENTAAISQKMYARKKELFEARKSQKKQKA